MDRNAEVRRILSSIAQAQGCQHIPLSGNSKTRTAAFTTLLFDLLPEMIFRILHLFALRITLDLIQDAINLLHLQIDNIIHQTLAILDMLLEFIKIEISIFRERVLHIRIEVDCQEPATVIRTERDLPTRIRAHSPESEISIAVGHALTEDRIPEQDPRLGTLPGIMHDLAPQFTGRNRLCHLRVLRVNRELLHVRFISDSIFHEFIIDLHADISASNLTLFQLSIDEILTVRMLDAYRKHQSAATTILRHLTSRITVPFHERHQSRTGQGRVVDR